MDSMDLSRRQFLANGAKNVSTLVLASAAGATLFPQVSRARAKPNILFIAVDDLNDWIEPLGGYAGVRTPNFNRLAAMTRLYTRAYTSAPACSAARSSVLFGVQPFHSGVYTNSEDWQIGSRLVGQKTLPRFLKDQGYATIGAGKIFHDGWRSAASRPVANDPDAWTHYEFCGDAPASCEPPTEEEEAELSKDVVTFNKELAFGPTDLKTSEMPDVVRTKWFIRNVLSKRHDRPFFGAIGLQKPHGPFTVPRKFFDLYDPRALHYPPGVLDPRHNTLQTNADVADLPPAAIAMLKQYGVKDHAEITGGHKNYWQDIVHAYLATISFTDHCLGLLLDGWLKGPNASNTIVVLWSDHGWQLGEKMGWRKFTLWERATRVPYMIGGSIGDAEIRPGKANFPVSTLSLFPTLSKLAFDRIPKGSDLGGLGLDGESLHENLLDGGPVTDHALTTWMLKTEDGDGEGKSRHFSVRTARHRLIAYGNGNRELYDHGVDPYEFDNLMARPTAETNDITRTLLKLLPDRGNCAARAVKPSAKAA